VPYYDRDKFKGELADDMKIGDMSVTFKLKKNAKFHDGARSRPRTSNGRSIARSASAASRPSR
jgi:ABC-type transport system substrate-binding protein